MAAEDKAIESNPAPIPPPPQGTPLPITQEPTVFDRAVQAVNNQIGALNFQQQVDKEMLKEKDNEIAILREQVKQLESTLAPFLAVEQDTETPSSEAGSTAAPEISSATNGKTPHKTPAPN